ncbi:uncharacterized protein LOC141866295 [Acropora palmata]|uniref:uncharacterized protein LOC141866295 n=1 Tax=Acropora palmata TaxID=6131 RepID=UPI003DA196E7
MNERSRKISEMSWRYRKCGEFGIQQVKQSARVVVFAEVTTTSISVVVPSGNSSICFGVEHCISKLQVVEEFGRRNALNPSRQHEVIFTWFTRELFCKPHYPLVKAKT